MKSMALFLNPAAAGVLTASLIFSGCDGGNPFDYSVPARIEFTISGGLAGGYGTTIIDENGLAEQRSRYFENDLVIHYQLTPGQLDSLKAAFDEADFFSLKSQYRPPDIINDGFFYSISYSIAGRSKTVEVESGSGYPKKLEQLLERLSHISHLLQNNPDGGTLFMSLGYTIKRWPFSDFIRLESHANRRVFFNNTPNYREIFEYLRAQQQEFSMFISWEDEHFYNLYPVFQGPRFEDNIGSHFRRFRSDTGAILASGVRFHAE